MPYRSLGIIFGSLRDRTIRGSVSGQRFQRFAIGSLEFQILEFLEVVPALEVLQELIHAEDLGAGFQFLHLFEAEIVETEPDLMNPILGETPILQQPLPRHSLHVGQLGGT